MKKKKKKLPQILKSKEETQSESTGEERVC